MYAKDMLQYIQWFFGKILRWSGFHL